ncbi:MAG: signal peptidase II [Bdellovibrionales bacterium]|nr:signal peptidase II [Bdellovibrionales bacterium]
MEKKDWFFIIAAVFLVWFLDQITKQWALQNIYSLKFYGPFGLVLIKNPGAILGAFSHLPPLLRVVSLSTGGAFLISIYASIQYLLPRRSFVLRSGMSILLGGILGNVTDRILDSAVVDFLVIRFFGHVSPAFNLADAFQWLGYGMVVITLLKEGDQLWPSENERKRTWVLPKFQRKFTLVSMAIGLAFVIISGVYSYTYLKVSIHALAASKAPGFEDQYLIPFLETFVVVVIGFLFLLLIIGRLISHRIAGPIYAFELFLEDVLQGKDRPLRLRAGDDFQHLEDLSERVRHHLKTNFQTLAKNDEKTLNKDEPVETGAEAS